VRATARRQLDDMTLGYAVDYVQASEGQAWACACPGGPYCCIKQYRLAQALIRGGHIAVKQIAGLAKELAKEVEGR